MSSVVKPLSLDYHPPRMITIPGNVNPSGAVHFWENEELFPKGIRRCFWISGVAAGESRGNHAHWREAQVIVAVAGKLSVEVHGANGENGHFELEGAGSGLFVPPLNWVEIRFSQDAILLGLGDREFHEDDFIRDKDYFESLQKGDL